jgi:hypothetical protein
MAQPVIRHAYAVAMLVGPLSGCILIAPTFEPQDHCSFNGSGQCATCIRTHCQAPIDTCCGADGCVSAMLPAVDDCGEGQGKACGRSLATTRTKPDEEAVRSCITSNCTSDCIVSDGGPSPAWSCAVSRESDKSCAQCIYTKCTAALDEYCAEQSNVGGYISELQKEMSACVAGDQPGCAWLLSKSTSGLEGVVRGCIAKSCGTTCMGDGRPHASCTLHSAGAYCTCSDAEASSGSECSVAKVGGTCVIGKSGCTCGTYACTSAGSRCSCTFDEGGGTTSCRPQKGLGDDTLAKCCLELDSSNVSCACDRDTTKCYTELGEYEVPSCDEHDLLATLEASGRVAQRCSR